MAASQFHNQAKLQSDGRVLVTGTQQDIEPLSAGPEVEYRFLLVRGDVVVKGSGQGHGSQWTGLTDPGEQPLDPGPVLALGLLILARRDNNPGFATFSWSEQIELVRA
jgi:hypothetical protein